MDQIETLQREAQALRQQAEALGESYRRSTWLRFVLVFFPVPFVLLLLRLQVEAWHYYLFGGAYIVFAAALYVWDGRAAQRWEAAERAADEAQRAADASVTPTA
jgi:hypothetical protein